MYNEFFHALLLETLVQTGGNASEMAVDLAWWASCFQWE